MYQQLEKTQDIIATRHSWSYNNMPAILFYNPNVKKSKNRTKTDETAPDMVTVRELANRTGLSENHIRKLCKTDKIKYIRAGVKYLINYDRFIDYLNGKI